MSGRFIVLEGIDGSGKSTQAEILAARLKKQGAHAYLTREPSDGVIGKFIAPRFERGVTDERASDGGFICPPTVWSI